MLNSREVSLGVGTHRSSSVPPLWSRRQQGGAVAIIFAITLVLILGMVGMAIDASRVYNRNVELQGIANAAALAAARQLDGTTTGITAAVTAASNAVASATYSYGNSTIAWSDAAIQFSGTAPPNANWGGTATAIAAPATMFYVKVDLNALPGDHTTMQTVFIKVISSNLTTVNLSKSAIAGRTTIGVTPFAICAMSASRAAVRTYPGSPARSELFELGFRRGVSYDLMQLNPNGSTPQTYVVDPIAPPGVVGNATNTSVGTVRPFICAGQMWMPSLSGGAISVAAPFPLGSLFNELNSRFGTYSSGSCKPGGSPPDFNIKSYTYNGGSAWMGTSPTRQSAAPVSSPSHLGTIADFDYVPGAGSGPLYGPLWSYAKSVAFSEYKSGESEPSAGYSPYPTSAWSALYFATLPTSAYPASATASTPYSTSAGTFFSAPPVATKILAKRNRRVLNIPLLACAGASATSGQANVLGVGRFFMTVPATASSIIAEFAGVSDGAPGASVELL